MSKKLTNLGHIQVSPEIGYYTQDPGHRSPSILLARSNSSVLVYEVRPGFITIYQNSEWAPIKELKTRVLEVTTGPRHNNGGPMEDIRGRLIAGYVDVLLEAIRLAPDVGTLAAAAVNNHHAIAAAAAFEAEIAA